MLILRTKNYTDNYYIEYPGQVISDALDGTIGYTENALDYVDQSRIGQTTPVKKKTRMVKNVISGIKGYIPRKNKKKNNYVH